MTWRTIVILLAIWAVYRLVRRALVSGSGPKRGGGSKSGRSGDGVKGDSEAPVTGPADESLDHLTQQDISDADYEEIP